MLLGRSKSLCLCSMHMLTQQCTAGQGGHMALYIWPSGLQGSKENQLSWHHVKPTALRLLCRLVHLHNALGLVAIVSAISLSPWLQWNSNRRRYQCRSRYPDIPGRPQVLT